MFGKVRLIIFEILKAGNLRNDGVYYEPRFNDSQSQSISLGEKTFLFELYLLIYGYIRSSARRSDRKP